MKTLLAGILLSVTFLPTSWCAELDHPLVRAIREGNLAQVESFMQQGTPADLRTPNGTTPLMLAARDGSPAMVKVLLDHGADPNAKNKIGVTPLIWGARNHKTVRLLLKAGADPNTASGRGITPLIAAAGSPNSFATVQLLVKQGADIDAQSNSGIRPLYQAAAAGDIRSARLLLEKGADPNQARGNRSPLNAAADLDNLEMVTLLLEHGADPNVSNGFNGHALNAALMRQNHDMAEQLIKAGARVDKPRATGNVPPIMLAAYTETGGSQLARLLVEHGADVTLKNDRDETVLTWASTRGFPDLVSFLKEAGAPEGRRKQKEIPNRDVTLTPENRQELLAASIQKSIDLLQKSSDAFLRNRESCISCHHQNIPSVAMSWARDKGFNVNPDSVQRMIDRQLKSWRRNVDEAYQMDDPVPVPTRFLGWGLLGFGALGHPPDDITDAMAWYLAAIQQPDGHWQSDIPRPPMGTSSVLSTVLAMRSLQLYAPVAQRASVSQRVRRAREWLEKQEPQTHQQRVFQLLGLGWAGQSANTSTLKSLTASLLEAQRDDGGWAQLPHSQSDAWATGITLVALRIAGGLPTGDAAYQNGLQFLLRTEFEDGSWFVKSRTWPFQPHFDSRFPHGRDQWISAPATAWATMAMTLAVDPVRPGTASVRDVFLGGKPPNESRQASEPKKVAIGEFDFAGKIKPILERSCLDCHGDEKPKASLRLTSRENLLKGGESGEAVIQPGQGADSLLVRVAAGLVEDLEMPPPSKRDKYPALSTEELENLRQWIDRGAPWQTPGE